MSNMLLQRKEEEENLQVLKENIRWLIHVLEKILELQRELQKNLNQKDLKNKKSNLQTQSFYLHIIQSN